MVVDRGQLVWSAAFGLRRKNPELPMTPETTLWAGSVTKAVFGTYVMQLAEREGLPLDVPIAEQLGKPLDSYEVYRESGTALVADPRWKRVTPRILLSHTSGLGNLSMFEPDKKMHIHREPGSEYRYSGDGLNLIQLVLEKKKGKLLDQLMQEALFSPLGMKQTGIIYRAEFGENVADRFGAAEQFLAQTRRFPARAAGSMTTSAEDLAKFVLALFEGRILQTDVQKKMLLPAVKIRTVHQVPMPNDAAEGSEASRVGLAYGMGWGLLTKTKYGRAFFKEGHGDGAQNYMICFEKRQTCMIVLTNNDNGELAFRPLFEKILGNTVTPWEWESYTPEAIAALRNLQ